MKRDREVQIVSETINFNIIAVFLAVFISIVWILTSTIVTANSESNVILEFDKTEAEVGEIVRATVKVNNIKNLAGYQINISYDPDVVTVVNANTGVDASPVVTGDLINNQEYGILPVLSNEKDKGLIAVGRTYLYLDDYKEDGQPEESGILFEIGFKILKKETTSIAFTDEKLPNSVGGTALFNWYGDRINNYTVKTPQKINLSSLPTIEPSPDTTPEPTYPDTESVSLVPKLNTETGEANITAKIDDLLTAINKAKIEEGVKRVILNIEAVEGSKAYVLELPTDLFSNSNLVYKILVSTEFGTVEIPSNFFSQKGVPAKITGSSAISLSIKTSNLEGLDDESKNKIGKKPIIEVDMLVDGEKIEWSSLSTPLEISVPYVAFLEELENHEYIVVWHIEKDTNKVVPVTSGRYYTSPLNRVKFMTNTFGKFAVSYNHKTFNDISSYSWAIKQIEVLASKGVIRGTSENTFTPGEDITRADFIILLVKSLGLYSEIESNFNDVPSESYYFEYVGIAKQLGITSGVGNNMFKPLEKITRQDMMVLTANALNIANKLSDNTGSQSSISGFNDRNEIASYAIEGVATLVKEGIVVGSENKINPLGNATRAELAAIIYKIYYM